MPSQMAYPQDCVVHQRTYGTTNASFMSVFFVVLGPINVSALTWVANEYADISCPHNNLDCEGTSFFEDHFHVRSLSGNSKEISSAIYLQVSIISQALIFVTCSQSWSFMERPGSLVMCAYALAQLVATLIAVYAEISFASISVIGWGWAGIIWLYSLIFYIPLDIIKFAVRYSLSGEAWNLVFDRKFLHQTAFTSKHDYGKDNREAKGVLSQRTTQGLMSWRVGNQ
ncbi:hypothetical protein RHMOL_Rhmol06G0178200 [Rhododendron molle]|uniref:Uncharacterized protein n=1 Tax=Rhododendron molle TaxID=49168 RepID=A0ACC0NFF1_RHOML|nr:hypothetical protein RHMOL_Rhmol06G0178200 [Rhododendron molle]